MLRASLLTSVFSIVASLAVGVPVAHAGGGPGQSLPPGTTTCHVVSGAGNPPQVINLTDNLSNQDVQVNPPALLCDLDVAATVVKGPGLSTVGAPNLVMCYNVAAAPNAQKVPATINDPFGTHDVQVGGLTLLCVPAQVQ